MLVISAPNSPFLIIHSVQVTVFKHSFCGSEHGAPELQSPLRSDPNSYKRTELSSQLSITRRTIHHVNG